ncbi:hypothetical protein BFS16_04715 [Hoylesella timonensis]|uniref:Uncharacterized protein n=1 Tax=Hoylesella timonensis TaxID=386414 RepID=A0A2K0XMA9_9BACT|nr:hypothetical protein [Hoylesella timonensis]PNP95666.1 hypothetical protein BFS16_04715 [Hoylesella timonensis]
MKQKDALSLKTLTKSSVWDIQENDVFRLWEAAEKDADLKDNMRHYLDVIRSAFEIEEVKIDKPVIIKKYEERGFKVKALRIDGANKQKYAIKKKAILRVTDLSYENIRHITASKLLEVLDRNFGGGWDSLSQSIKDIIESGFDISTTTLPQNRLHNAGGMYEKKVNDGFEVLEIAKGAWVEAIFAKAKPEMEKKSSKLSSAKSDSDDEFDFNEKKSLDEGKDIEDNEEEDDDTFDEDKLTEESYRTTFDSEPEDLDLEAEDVADDEEF